MDPMTTMALSAAASAGAKNLSQVVTPQNIKAVAESASREGPGLMRAFGDMINSIASALAPARRDFYKFLRPSTFAEAGSGPKTTWLFVIAAVVVVLALVAYVTYASGIAFTNRVRAAIEAPFTGVRKALQRAAAAATPVGAAREAGSSARSAASAAKDVTRIASQTAEAVKTDVQSAVGNVRDTLNSFRM